MFPKLLFYLTELLFLFYKLSLFLLELDLYILVLIFFLLFNLSPKFVFLLLPLRYLNQLFAVLFGQLAKLSLEFGLQNLELS